MLHVQLPPCPPPLLLAGPTASGKSEVAMILAQTLPGEIVSVDSMQVYQGLDIGTAKPSQADRQLVRHHLIDILPLQESFDAARFTILAHSAVKEIQSRSAVPILCGGTGMYFKAFLEGLTLAPAYDAKTRADLERTSLAEMLKELQQKDSAAYEQIDRKNPRRIIRALEVIRLSGRPYSEQRAGWNHPTGSRGEPGGRALLYGLALSREELRQRIDSRVERMFELGLVAETKRLMHQGLEQNRTAMQALGYRQVVEHLLGARSLEETIELVKARTRQYARRQRTWFRRQLPVFWITAEAAYSAQELAETVQRHYREALPKTTSCP